MVASRRIKLAVAFTVLIVVVSGTYAFLSLGNRSADTLTVFSADAYVPEVKALLSSFHNSTGTDFAPVHGGGSYTDARQIALGSPASAFISVSLDSYSKSYLGNFSSGWALAFAADQMVLAYTENSLNNNYALSIVNDFRQGVPSNNTTTLNQAFSVLVSGKVKVGISDPQSDPAGVRAMMLLEMAGHLYGGGNASHYIDLLAENAGNVSRASAAELVSPLELGQIQFLFIYKSAAISHGLSYVELPAAVNQGNASLSGFYSQFSYTSGGSTVYGSPILLFFSLLDNGTYQSGASLLLSYLLNNTVLFSSYGLVLLTPMSLYGNASGVPQIQWGLSKGIITQKSTEL